MKRQLGFVFGAGVLAALGASFAGRNEENKKTSIPTLAKPVPSTLAMQSLEYSGTRAPEFPAGLTWLNTRKPLSVQALRGKIVLLDFWTYGCINCMHILPDLKKLEEKYGHDLVVISVHSAKFAQESEAANIRNAVLRYHIDHPVLVDKGMRVWDEYAVRAWPTLVLIDPAGRVAGQVAGEGNYDVLDKAIGRLAQTFRAQHKLNETPLKIALESAQIAPTALFYPGKITVGDGKIFVADSSHNRLVVSDANGANPVTIGSGEATLKDGNFQSCAFFNPQGLFYEDGTLYVADTNNHAIRAVDLKAKTVRTIAGTGQQAAWGATGGSIKETALSSPWDLLKKGDAIYIAMAGTHQIWKLDLAKGIVAPWAGNGGEARRDGALADASFAQPSGLATDGQSLFVADSESSSIRAIDFASGQVSTLAGGDLFDFGDRDGLGDSARFQHPLGLAYKGGFLYIADTYNSKIKKLDVQNGRVTTLYGGGNKLTEPGGLVFDGEKLLIADTAHHTIKSLNLKSDLATPIVLKLAPPQLGARATKADDAQTIGRVLLAPQNAAKFVFDVKLPTGYHLNRAAPLSFKVAVKGNGLQVPTTEFRDAKFTLPLSVPLKTAGAGQGSLEIEALIAYCDSGTNAICKVEKVTRSVPFQIAAGGKPDFQLNVAVK